MNKTTGGYMRERFERLYAKNNMSGTLADVDSVKCLRDGDSYADENIQQCWFYFKMAIFE